MKKTNIQELYERLIAHHKKIILFGIGGGQYCITQINLFLNVICDNWDTPYYIENSGTYTYTFDNIVNYIEFAVDNDKAKVAKGYFELEGKRIKVYSVDTLSKVDTEKYIVLIATRRYEREIKEQICKIDRFGKIEYYGFFSDLQHYERKNRGLIAERIIMPYMELIRQPYYQKNRVLTDLEEYRRLLAYISAGKYVNNVIGFEVTTVCNLKCENCADYIPRLKKHEYIPTETVIEDIDVFFKAADLVFCVTLVSGEVLFHPGIKQILNKLISIDKVERIDLVTNGICYPEDEELLNILTDKKIMIHMSNYNMPERTDISRKFYEEHGIDIRFMEEQLSWKLINPEPYNRKYGREVLERIYLKCSLARCCPQIIRKGKIYLCGRAIRFKQITVFDSDHDWENLEKKPNDIKRQLLDFKIEPYMDACNWCDWTEAEGVVRPGEQQI